MSRPLFDLRHPFFAPPLRRVITVAVIAGWATYELVRGSVFFAILFGALAVYCWYEFFVAFDPDNYKDPDEDEHNRPSGAP